MKKVFAILIILGTAAALWASYSSLEKRAQLQKDPIEAVPTNAAIFIESKNIKQLWSQLAETNLIWSEITAIPTISNLDQNIRFVDSILSSNEQLKGFLENTKTVISLHPEGESIALNTVAICDDEQYNAILNQLKNSSINVEKTPSKGLNIQSILAKEKRYYFYHYKPFLITSTSLSSIQNAIDQISSDEIESLTDQKDFVNLAQTSSEFASGHVYVNNENLALCFQPYLTKEATKNWSKANLPNLMMADLNIKSNALMLTGLSTMYSGNPNEHNSSSQISDVLPDHIEYLKKQKSTQVLLPNKLDELALNSTAANCECDPIQILNGVIDNEIAHIKFSKNYQTKKPLELILFPTKGNENILGPLTQLGVNDSIVANQFQTSFYKIEDASFVKMIYPEIKSKDLYFAASNNFGLIGDKKAIGKILYKWKKQQNVVSDSRFIRFNEDYMAKYTNNDLYSKPAFLYNSFINSVKPEYKNTLKTHEKIVKNLTDFVWQSSASQDSLTFQSIVLAVNNNTTSSSDGTLWQIALKNPITTVPQLMKNHRTNTLEIFVEDTTNTIHLIGATGKIKWSKEIKEPIIGKVKQIDIYKNNKFQMLFNTATKIHLLDINGNEVKGFPIKLPEQATNSVSVFDYDNNKNYRFTIATIDKKIRMYNNEANAVKGWSTPATQAIVVDDIRHFRIEGKDYIFTTDITGNTYFWERKGSVRYELKNKFFTPFKHDVVLNKSFSLSTSKIFYLDSAYNVCSLRFNDSIGCYSFNADKDKITFLTDLNKDGYSDFITAFDNRFEVYGTDQSVLFFESFEFPTKEALFIINGQKGDKYIGLANDGEIWIFNNRFQQLQSMPVKGSKLTTAGDLNKDGKLNVVSITDENTVVVYQIDNLQL